MTRMPVGGGTGRGATPAVDTVAAAPLVPSGVGTAVEFTSADLVKAACALEDRVRAHRRALHRTPELAFEEFETADYIEGVLRELGVEHYRVVGTGVVGIIRGRGRRCVAVRADMDALPVAEAEGREGYRSENQGVSHACGHDAHVAVGLGLAEVLAGLDDLPGTVALYFQPAEEGPGGAEPMVQAGVLDEPAPGAVLALHVASQYEAGQIAVRSGPVNAAADLFSIKVRGVGGHAAHPETAVDAVLVASHVMLALQSLVAREIDPVRPAVLTVGSINGGTRPNVIAQEVVLEGTIRTLHEPVRDHLVRRIREIAEGTAAAHRATANVVVEEGYAAGYNDKHLTTVVADAARAVVGSEQVIFQEEPSLGSEDFFEFGATGLPVCMFRLGIANLDQGIEAPHHSPDFDVDEAALPLGVAVFAEAIRRLLTDG